MIIKTQDGNLLNLDSIRQILFVDEQPGESLHAQMTIADGIVVANGDVRNAIFSAAKLHATAIEFSANSFSVYGGDIR